MANHNLAYDLATFESTSPRKREQEQVIRKVAKRSDAVVHPIKAILLIVLLVTITSSMILSMVQLTELNDQINQEIGRAHV